MATTAEAKQAIAKTQAKDLRSMIEGAAKELSRALPEHMKPERLVRIALTSIRLNPDLAKCTPESFLGSLFVAAQTGLEPVAGRSYLIPFNNSRKKEDGTWHSVKECQFVIGYKGLIELFFRHEAAVSIDMQAVHENDDFTYQYGTESFLRHKPAMKNRGEVIGYYAVAKVKSGGTVFYYLSREDAIAHGQKHSKTFDKKSSKFYDGSPWAKEFDAMAMKTALIQLAKKLPLSIEVQRAIQADESSRDFRSGIQDVFDLPPTTDWIGEEKPETKELPPSEKASDGVIEVKPEAISLTEYNKADAWTIRTTDQKKYWTASKEIAEFAKNKAKAAETFRAATEKREPGVWIVETV